MAIWNPHGTGLINKTEHVQNQLLKLLVFKPKKLTFRLSN